MKHNSMRVLHVMAGSPHGGAETACIDMVCAMADSNVETAILTRPHANRKERIEAHGVQFLEAPFGGFFDFKTSGLVQKTIKDFQPDIVQSWMSRGASYVPKWHFGMVSPRYVHVGRLGSPYRAKYFKSCDAVTGITPELAEHGVSFGLPRDCVRHINNFADMDPAQKTFCRADYQTPDDAVILLGLGRLHDDKAFDVLIRVAAELPDHFYVWIAGEGPDREMLEALARDLGVSHRVRFLGWQDDRAALFKAVDLCVFISRDEGFGTVFVQSWAAGVPVIVSDADGPRQFVRDGQDGLIVPREDVGATVQAILTLDADKGLQSCFIANGQARYESEFTKKASVESYLEFYRYLLQRT